MTRMNWSKLRYHGKPTLSVKDEFERLKRQDQWRRARVRNQEHGQYSFNLRRPSVTASSSTEEAPPW